MLNEGIVLERSTIYERIWGYDFGTSSKSLDVYIGYLRRKTEADSADKVFSAGPPPLFLPATELPFGRLKPCRSNQRTDTRRTTAFMGGQAQQIGTDCPHIDGDLSQTLCGITVDPGIILLCQFGTFSNRLDHTGFRLGQHKRAIFLFTLGKRISADLSRDGDNLFFIQG